MDRVLKTLKKNSRDQIRISLTEFSGRQVISIRVFYQDLNGEWLPGKQGLAITVDKMQPLLNALLEAAKLIGEGGNTLQDDGANE
jgi:hypothetical protein